MDNGRLDDVFLTGGGLNCRHTWIPIAPDSEEEALVDTGKFVDPVYEEDVAQVPEA
jgi:hypothetical protein